MVNLQLYPHRNTKINMEKLFEKISENDYEEAKYIANKIEEDLLKYYQTRGLECSIIYKLFDEFEYTLRIHSPGKNKTKKLYDFLGRISNISHDVTNPIEKIRFIREDLRYYYLNNTPGNIDIILGCFDDLVSLNSEMGKIGGTVYNYYTDVLKNISDCEALLGKYTTHTPEKKLLDELSTKFSNLFKSIMRVISPPVIVETNDEELYKMAKGGVSIKDLAEGMGVNESELDEKLRGIQVRYEQEENV